MSNPYEDANRLNGGADLTQAQIDALMNAERATRFVNIDRISLGLKPIPVDVAAALGRSLPPEPIIQPMPVVPTTSWLSHNTVTPFDNLWAIWARVQAKVAGHVGFEWAETTDRGSQGRTFTDADAVTICFAIAYQAGTYRQYARKLGISAEAAGRRIRILKQGGYLTTRVANPHKFRIASPTAKSLKLVGLNARRLSGDESQLMHRLMVTQVGLEHELAGDPVLSEYVIGIDKSRQLLFPSVIKPAEKTHRPDLVVRRLDEKTGEIRTISLEIERTRKRRRDLANVLWDTARSGRVDGVHYISPDRPIIKLVQELARVNKISDEVTTEFRALPDWAV